MEDEKTWQGTAACLAKITSGDVMDAEAHEVIFVDLSLSNVTDMRVRFGVLRQIHRKIRMASVEHLRCSDVSYRIGFFAFYFFVPILFLWIIYACHGKAATCMRLTY